MRKLMLWQLLVSGLLLAGVFIILGVTGNCRFVFYFILALSLVAACIVYLLRIRISNSVIAAACAAVSAAFAALFIHSLSSIPSTIFGGITLSVGLFGFFVLFDPPDEFEPGPMREFQIIGLNWTNGASLYLGQILITMAPLLLVCAKANLAIG